MNKMKEYQRQAIKDIDIVLEHLMRQKINSKYNEKLEWTIKRIQEVRSVLNNTHDKNRLIDAYGTMTIYIFPNLKMSDYEKTQLFFDIITPNLRTLTEPYPISSEVIMNELEKLGLSMDQIEEYLGSGPKKETIFQIRVKHPEEAETIISLVEINQKESNRITSNLQILKKYYYDRDRKPTIKGFKEIIRALTNLEIPKTLLTIIATELQKDIEYDNQIEQEDKKESNTHTYEKLGLSITSRRVMTDKEWKNLKRKVDQYYDIDSKYAIRSLDMKEGIELIELLRQLKYKEEEIEQILCSIDEQNPQTEISSIESSPIRNALIMKMLVSKSKLNERNLSKDIIDIEEILKNSQEKEKKFWREFLYETITLENSMLKKELEIRQTELKKMAYQQKAKWRSVFLEEVDYSNHSAVAVIKIILRELKEAPIIEKQKWKSCLLDTLERIELEERGNYIYEFQKADKLRKRSHP